MEARHHVVLPSFNNAFYKGRPWGGHLYRATGHHPVMQYFKKNTISIKNIHSFINFIAILLPFSEIGTIIIAKYPE